MKKTIKKTIVEVPKVEEHEIEHEIEPEIEPEIVPKLEQKVIEDVLVEDPISKKTKVLSEARLQALTKARDAVKKKKEIRVVKDEVQFQQFQKWLKQQNKEKMLSEYSQIMEATIETPKVKPFSEPTFAPFSSHRFL